MYLARVRGHCIEAWLGSWRDTRFYVNDVGTVIYQLAEAFLEYFCEYHFSVFSHLLPIFHPSIRFGFPVPVTGKNWKLGEKWDFSQFPKKLGKLWLLVQSIVGLQNVSLYAKQGQLSENFARFSFRTF